MIRFKWRKKKKRRQWVGTAVRWRGHMKFVITITPAVRDKGAGKMWNYRPPGFLLRALGGCGRVLVHDYDCDASSADAKDASRTQQILIRDRQI